jgi:hypothetical protein
MRSILGGVLGDDDMFAPSDFKMPPSVVAAMGAGTADVSFKSYEDADQETPEDDDPVV